MVEKPFTTTIADARQLLATAAEVGRTITVPYGWNYEAIARTALDLLAENPIGEIRHASVHMATATEELFSGEGLRGIENSLVKLKDSTHADPANFGGFSWIQLSHALGLFFLLIDRDPVEAFAYLGLSPTGTDLHNAAAVRLDNGATLAVSGSAGLAWGQKSQMELRIFGADGHITLDIEREWVRLDIKDGASHERAFPSGEGDYRCRGPLDHFIATCAGEASENLSSGLIGARSTAVLAGMRESAALNRPVALDPVA